MKLLKVLVLGWVMGARVWGGGLVPVDARRCPDLFVWTDTCNVYVLKDGAAALLVDLGDGAVLDHLAEIGVERVEWVLFTHHHREQCQGASRLPGTGASVAGPEAERGLFERPGEFRRMEVGLGDPFTVYGSSYVRPPIQPIRLDRGLGTNEVFRWRGRDIHCLGTPGNSPGALSFIVEAKGVRIGLSGDVMVEGARMHTWFDTEWDYGFAAGLRALRQTVERLEAQGLDWMLPSHGPVIRGVGKQLGAYRRKLEALERLYVRGYDVERAGPFQDKVSVPTVVSNMAQVTPHLFKFKQTNSWVNFNLILSASGRALLVDCGLLDEGALDTALEGMRRHFGLQAVDAIVVTHMHGDHFLEAEHMRARWGTQVWALDRMVDTMEHPEWFDYAAPVQAYGKKRADGSLIKGVRVDRAFRPGEVFRWEDYEFTVDWMPGQTEFALCLHGRIDGRVVAFTGDNIFGDPDNPRHTGHEAVVAHNSAILEEGYIRGAEYLTRLRPDILVGGHSFVMDHPTALIRRYREGCYALRDAFRALSSERDDRSWYDPFWVRAQPYRVSLRAGDEAPVMLHLRGFHRGRATYQVEVHPPPGLKVGQATVTVALASDSRWMVPIRVLADAGARPGVYLVGLDLTVDGRRYGERFDFVVRVE